MPYDYEQIANEIAGPDAREDVRAAALALHGGESLHMHEGISEREPCSYCWLRAGRAVKALRLVAGEKAAAAAKDAARLYRGVPVPADLGDEPWHDQNDTEQHAWRAGADDALKVHAPQVPEPEEQACPIDKPYPYAHEGHLWVSGRWTMRCPGKPMAADPAKENPA